jgi:serine/threonine protein kinase
MGEDFIVESTAAGLELEIPKLIGRYTYIRTLGTGSSCVVVEVVNLSTGEHFACKVVSRIALTEADEFGCFEQELRVHEFLRHRNIVRIHEIIFQPNHVFVVLDLCDGGDLLSFIVDHPNAYPSVHRPIVQQILEGLQYLHARGIAHRDIKPDNILLTSSHIVKLADFGCCEIANSGAEPRAGGTIYYAAPEIFLTRGLFGIKADIWSFGILIFTLFTGHLPWKDGDREEIIEQITHRQFSARFMLPTDAARIFEACTKLDPNERPTATQLLEDPWLRMDAGRKVPSIPRTGSQVLSLSLDQTDRQRRATPVPGPVTPRKRLIVRQPGTPPARASLRASQSQPILRDFQIGPNSKDV